jgi:hypothetical protein
VDIESSQGWFLMSTLEHFNMYFHFRGAKMDAKLHRTFVRMIALIVILTLMPSGLGLAVSVRPEAAVPFEGELTSEENVQVTLSFDEAMALTSTNVFQTGADRLTALQNNDGGWDWPLNDGNPASPSPKNTVGPIGQGLALAYNYTDDPDHLAALADAGSLLLGKQYNFSPSDGYLAATLDEIFGVTTYTDHVKLYFYDPLANGGYDRNGVDTNYDAHEYVNLIRTSRSGSQANMAAWDIGMGLVGAAAVGADTSAWIAGVVAEIDELNSSGWYDVLGLAGAIYGLAFVGEDYDPTAGSHAVANNLIDLGVILADYQLATGGFTWNSGYQVDGEGNESVQETAYAVLALNELSRASFLSNIVSAAGYLESVQLATSGWEGYVGSGENNEITGEALWALYNVNAYNQSPAAEANGPYMVAVGQSVALDSSGSFDPDGDPLTETWMETGVPALGMITGSTFIAGSAAGITEVTLTVDDGWDGTSTDTAMVVVYDPSGGFVTGGGWIDSPAGALAPSLVWNQGFETNTDGWMDANSSWYGVITRVASGTNGLASSIGSYHAVLEGDAESGPFSRFDGYRSVWPGTWTAEVDVYLDPAWASGMGFDYSVAATGSDGNHRRDYIFHVTKDTSTGKLFVAGSNNTNFAPRQDLENINHFEVTNGGWYTFQHVFRDQGGALAVDLNLLDANGNLLFTETRFDASDLIPTMVGGNRYGWFTFINVAGGIAVDEHQLFMPSNLTGRATFGFVSKYRRGATVPEGNTEFQFKAGNLNFHSTGYDWLVVNQGGTNAQFKGYGTINGTGNYGFMLWATDGSPDKFRIKIWDAATEAVVYDNGTDQAIGGGSIVVHRR